MLYPRKNEPSLEARLFEDPSAEYRGTPFWAWNCKLSREELERQIEGFAEMGFGGFHMHVRSGLCDEYLGEEFMGLIKDCRSEEHTSELQSPS